jgi:hypothetical protein
MKQTFSRKKVAFSRMIGSLNATNANNSSSVALMILRLESSSLCLSIAYRSRVLNVLGVCFADMHVFDREPLADRLPLVWTLLL